MRGQCRTPPTLESPPVLLLLRAPEPKAHLTKIHSAKRETLGFEYEPSRSTVLLNQSTPERNDFPGAHGATHEKKCLQQNFYSIVSPENAGVLLPILFRDPISTFPTTSWSRGESSTGRQEAGFQSCRPVRPSWPLTTQDRSLLRTSSRLTLSSKNENPSPISSHDGEGLTTGHSQKKSF